nr:GGDEF domain-containing protein [uncultured Rhodopila sp.]
MSANASQLRHPASEPKQSVRWLSAVGMAVVFGMLAVGVMILLQARDDAWRQAQLSSANLALALERDIARNISSYDLSLQGAADALRLPGIDRVSPEIRQMAIFDRAISAEYLGSLLVLDAGATIIADSTSIVPHTMNFADRDYFLVHRDRPDAGLFVSRPFHSRMREGDASIAISRRINTSGGQFQGVVVGTLRLSYFQDRFAALDLGRKGSVALFRTDGRLIMRRPSRDGDFDRILDNRPAFEAFAKAQSGHFVGAGSLDGVERLITFRHIDNLPLILTIGLAVDDINATWWPKTAGVGALLIALCGATISLCLLFEREIRRRTASETAFMEAAGRISVFTDTDILTRLDLRRTFEARLSNEWQRAIRSETSIAVLLLDIDLFKTFNQTHGRAEGDRALCRIAKCVRHSLARPGDAVARYGDDDFAGLLPETELDGLLTVAEKIRSAVVALHIQRRDRSGKYLTVSVGGAVALPGSGSSEAALIGQATAALAKAKQDGGNQVSVAGSAETDTTRQLLSGANEPRTHGGVAARADMRRCARPPLA